MTPMVTIFDRPADIDAPACIWLEIRNGLHAELLEETEHESVIEAQDSILSARWEPASSYDGEHAILVTLC